MRVFIGLGSNVGCRRKNIARAIEFLKTSPGIRVNRQAPWYETEPVGMEDQRWFINTVLEAETELSPHELLSRLKEAEREVGRRDRGRWGPREVDLDLLLYEDLTLEEDDLVLPHPQLHLRRFVLVPLCQLSPEVVHPRLQKPLRVLLADLNERKKVIRLA
jgi:2-amino-4-hydroxy-6-hydroxymethyldihydropteridine diphosphokinase